MRRVCRIRNVLRPHRPRERTKHKIKAKKIQQKTRKKNYANKCASASALHAKHWKDFRYFELFSKLFASMFWNSLQTISSAASNFQQRIAPSFQYFDLLLGPQFKINNLLICTNHFYIYSIINKIYIQRKLSAFLACPRLANGYLFFQANIIVFCITKYDHVKYII